MGRKSDYQKDTYAQLAELMAKVDKLEAEHKQDRKEIKRLNKEVDRLQAENSSLREEVATLRQENAILTEKCAALTKENALLREDNERMKRILNNDSSNSSIPPSQDKKGKHYMRKSGDMVSSLEYIKWYWKHDYTNEEPVILFYELDINEDRYGIRIIEVYADRHMEILGDEGSFITEAPVPTVEEINKDNTEGDNDKFWAFKITKEEFEHLWLNYSSGYKGNIDFPD